MLIQNYCQEDDQKYVAELYHELHRCPELGFDLPKTLAIVRRELRAMDIPFSEECGESSIVATINGDCKGHTVGFRADMDALPIQEATGLPYASEHPGKMHACGHDSHTAGLLGTARLLKRAEKDLHCRVKLFFQPSEECARSGAEEMVSHGALEGVDEVIGLHVEVPIKIGTLGFNYGAGMAACEPFTIEFFGKSVHATLPQKGIDALAMAVKAYNDIYLMKCRELNPFAQHVLSISSIQAGTVHNVIADYAKMLISFRYFDEETHELVDRRIRQICENAAAELGGTVKITGKESCGALINNPEVAKRLQASAEKIVGKENIVDFPTKLSSEDFSHFTKARPGAFIRLGIGDNEKGITEPVHTALFRANEDAIFIGSKVFAQYALDFEE